MSIIDDDVGLHVLGCRVDILGTNCEKLLKLKMRGGGGGGGGGGWWWWGIPLLLLVILLYAHPDIQGLNGRLQEHFIRLYETTI